MARRIDHKERSSPSSNNRSGRESANSLLTNSSGTETLGGAKSSPATPTPDHSGTTDASDTTVIFNDHKVRKSHSLQSIMEMKIQSLTFFVV